jgi:hypothetical protein
VTAARQVTPSKSGKAVIITGFPATNRGMTWDEMDGPDIFYDVRRIISIVTAWYLVENAMLHLTTFTIVPFDLVCNVTV